MKPEIYTKLGRQDTFVRLGSHSDGTTIIDGGSDDVDVDVTG